MKAKIVLIDNELIISLNIKRLLKLKNLYFNVRFESDEAVNEIIKTKNPTYIKNDVELNNIEEELFNIINSKDFQNNIKEKYLIKQNRYGLTPREKEVLTLLVRGLTKQEIANNISLSFHTVDSHLRNIYKKLNIKSRSQAVAKTINEKLIQD